MRARLLGHFPYKIPEVKLLLSSSAEGPLDVDLKLPSGFVYLGLQEAMPTEGLNNFLLKLEFKL